MEDNKLNPSFNKDCISEAVCKLLEQKKLSDIKVEDIVNASGLSRITYFRHFKSKIEAVAYKILRDYGRYKEEPENETFNYDSNVKLFRFHLSYKDTIYSKLTNEEFSFVIVLFCTTHFKGVELDTENKYRLAIIVYSFIGVMSLWKEQGFKESPEEISKYLEGIIK